LVFESLVKTTFLFKLFFFSFQLETLLATPINKKKRNQSSSSTLDRKQSARLFSPWGAGRTGSRKGGYTGNALKT
jgi:hypothetical protein